MSMQWYPKALDQRKIYIDYVLVKPVKLSYFEFFQFETQHRCSILVYDKQSASLAPLNSSHKKRNLVITVPPT